MVEVYMHTNIYNNEKYIGYSKFGMQSRWLQHVNESKKNITSIKFHNAIRKNGADAFTHKVLAIVPTTEEAKQEEIKWIAFYDTFLGEGYNMTKGGDGVSLPGHLNGMYGRTHSKEAKAIFSKKAREMCISKNPNKYENLSVPARKKRDYYALKNKVYRMLRKRPSIIAKSNSTKAHKGTKNGRANQFVITSPNGNEFTINLLSGMKVFCEENKLVYNVMYKYRNNQTIPSPAKGDTKYLIDEIYKIKRDNTTGWNIQKRKING